MTDQPAPAPASRGVAFGLSTRAPGEAAAGIRPPAVRGVPPDVEAVLSGERGHPALAPTQSALTAATAADLARLARHAAADERAWRALVRFDPERRWACRIGTDDRHETWLMTWLPGQRSSLHDHGTACGAFAVARGTVEERTVAHHPGAPAAPGGAAPHQSVRRLTTGHVRVFGPHHLHEVSNPGPEPAVCVYVYTPARPDMDTYEVVGARLVPTGQESGRARDCG